MSNTDQMIKQFETTFNRTEQTVRSEYGDEQYRDELVKHLKRTGVLTRTNIDEVSSFAMAGVRSLNSNHSLTKRGLRIVTGGQFD